MTRCKDFYEKVRRDGDFCGMKKQTLENVEAYMAFLEENPTIVGISEGAARVVMRLKNPIAKAKVIKTIGKDLNKGRTPTAVQIATKVQNIEAGKSNRGGNHKGASKVEDKLVVELSDFTNPVEPNPDEAYPYEGEGDADTGNIPILPDEEEEVLDVTPEPVIATPNVEEIGWNNPEITEKVVKERAINAGEKDVPKESKSILLPTEEAKQAIFDKCIKQAYEWGLDGDEIARRMKKSIMFVYPSGLGGAK